VIEIYNVSINIEFDISYANQEITPWGGMVFLLQMLDKIGFKSQVESCIGLPKPGSNRGYSINQCTVICNTMEKYIFI
jgi:recombinational DNA repair protein (RecF pathway)